MEERTITNVLIVDDHQMFIDGVKLVLRKVADVNIVGEANNGYDAQSMIEKLQIDLVILDIHIPQISGTKLARIIKKEHPSVKILVVTSYQDEKIIADIFESEAEGYILKSAGKQVLIEALTRIISGGVYYCNEFTYTMLKNFKADKKRIEKVKDLTEREIEILKLICKEYTTAEIAEKLFISPHTVDSHRKHILVKTNSKSIVGLIKFAMENKII